MKLIFDGRRIVGKFIIIEVLYWWNDYFEFNLNTLTFNNI